MSIRFDFETGEILQDVPSWAGQNAEPFTVSGLSAALKRTLEDGYAHVRVRGEISKVSVPQSGHVYFDLKDCASSLACVIWRGTVSRLAFKPQAGAEVIALGKITTFPGQSKYQLVISSLELAGAGALMALLAERKAQFEKEGLFAQERKRPLPFLPQVIGVITSPTGAVIRDILHRLADRFPRRVLIWPVRVQGETCAQEVAAAISGFNRWSQEGGIARPDVLIVARGGGSLEDLWGFQEEIVVRAAFASAIPLISAIGHETDITLLDYVADVRAPTPTAAAEMAVPVRQQIVDHLAVLGGRLVRAFERSLNEKRYRVQASGQKLPHLQDVLAFCQQRFDMASGRLSSALLRHVQLHRLRFARLEQRLSPHTLQNWVARRRDLLPPMMEKVQRLILFYTLERRRERVRALAQLLTAFSYRSVLARGFVLVRDDQGQTVRSIAHLEKGKRLSLEFHDGRVPVAVVPRLEQE